MISGQRSPSWFGFGAGDDQDRRRDDYSRRDDRRPPDDRGGDGARRRLDYDEPSTLRKLRDLLIPSFLSGGTSPRQRKFIY